MDPGRAEEGVADIAGLGLDWVEDLGGADCRWDELAGEEGETVAVGWRWLLVVGQLLDTVPLKG